MCARFSLHFLVLTVLELADAVKKDLIGEGLVEEYSCLALLEKGEHLIQVLQYCHLDRLFALEEEYDEKL